MLSKRAWVQGHTHRDASQHREGDMPPIQQGLKCHLLPHIWIKALDIQLLRLLALLERIHRVLVTKLS